MLNLSKPVIQIKKGKLINSIKKNYLLINVNLHLHYYYPGQLHSLITSMPLI